MKSENIINNRQGQSQTKIIGGLNIFSLSFIKILTSFKLDYLNNNQTSSLMKKKIMNIFYTNFIVARLFMFNFNFENNIVLYGTQEKKT